MTDSTRIDERDLALPPDEPTVGERNGGPSIEDAATEDASNVQAPPTAARSADILDVHPDDLDDDDGGVVPGGVELEADGMPPADVLYDALRAVIDPEIGYNVVDLGLVYDVEKEEDGHVQVTMTLTTMGCPLTEVIHQQVSVIMLAMAGVESVDVEFTFSPPWSPEMMSDDVREELRAMGMNV